MQSALSDFRHFFHGYFKFMSVDTDNDIKYSALKTIELRNKIVSPKNNIYHSNTFFLLTLDIHILLFVLLFFTIYDQLQSIQFMKNSCYVNILKFSKTKLLFLPKELLFLLSYIK